LSGPLCVFASLRISRVARASHILNSNAITPSARVRRPTALRRIEPPCKRALIVATYEGGLGLSEVLALFVESLGRHHPVLLVKATIPVEERELA